MGQTTTPFEIEMPELLAAAMWAKKRYRGNSDCGERLPTHNVDLFVAFRELDLVRENLVYS